MKRLLLLSLLTLALAACEREDREYRSNPAASSTEPQITMGSLSPGDTPPQAAPSGIGQNFEANAYHVANGKTYFSQLNCNGCHSNGGGGSGPALMDDSWIYGSAIENIAQTIREGRPNGMPSFRGKATDDQIWELAAYVRSLSGNVSPDVAPGRSDDLYPHPPEGQLTHAPDVSGGTPSPSELAPQ